MSHQVLQMFKNENDNKKVISGQERKTIKYIVLIFNSGMQVLN